MRAVLAGPIVNVLRKPLVPLWNFAEDHEDTLVGWFARVAGDVIDVITARLNTLPRVRFK